MSQSNNLIGTDRSGSKKVPNNGNGVFIFGNAKQNVVNQGNVISGNKLNGVMIAGVPDRLAKMNSVSGNLIGTDISGKLPLGNTLNGVLIQNTPDNTIGELGANAKPNV